MFIKWRAGPMSTSVFLASRPRSLYDRSSMRIPTGGFNWRMKQNPEAKRIMQRSLFIRLAEKSLELPNEKQQELQSAIAELLLTALPQNSMKEEANIDDDEQ